MPYSLVLVRHGETEWSRDGKHTSHTDLELTDHGRTEARSLAPLLARRAFALVLTSPRQRATETAKLAGFGDAIVDDDLAEWDYGAYEGRTTADIRADVPDWTLWDHRAPDGETAAQVTARADRVLARVHDTKGDILVFAHGHVLRALAARWLGLDVTVGRYLFLSSGSVSELGWEREQPVVSRWNVTPADLL